MLKRYPDRPYEKLQAWDAADELLLEHARGQNLVGKRVLVLNDAFGALSAGLIDQDLVSYTDSYLSFKATQINTHGKVVPISDLKALSGKFDLVLAKILKNLSFFEDLLCHVSGHLHPDSRVVSAYMIKYQTKASFELLNRIVGPTQTSLAKKKARLIFAKFERSPTRSPYPKEVLVQTELQDFEIPFLNHSNLFSREKLDIGTRFFLEHIPDGDYEAILDLGCGNGIIGIEAKRLNSAAKVIFCDESQMAIQSAQANYRSYFPEDRSAEFVWTNSFENPKPDSLDLVLCNPPFHQGTSVGDFVAQDMFKDAHRALKKGGLLRVIGNSHLMYQNPMKKIFGNSEYVARNPKFTIIDSVK